MARNERQKNMLLLQLIQRKRPMDYIKFTYGFVAQRFEEKDGKFVCIEQNFSAGDQVSREDINGDPIEISNTDEIYFPFEMVQPE
jgi:hypothetical protein